MNWRGLVSTLGVRFVGVLLVTGLWSAAGSATPELFGPFLPQKPMSKPQDTSAWPGGINPIYKIADRVLIEKTKRTLTLFAGDDVVKVYKIALGSGGPERKLKEGDRRTPIGKYRIAGRNPKSNFHLSLMLDYPNAQDIARAEANGVDPGNNIAIHGLRKDIEYMDKYHVYVDWTDGCVAVTNEEIEEIYRLVPDGAWVEILP